MILQLLKRLPAILPGHDHIEDDRGGLAGPGHLHTRRSGCCHGHSEAGRGEIPTVERKQLWVVFDDQDEGTPADRQIDPEDAPAVSEWHEVELPAGRGHQAATQGQPPLHLGRGEPRRDLVVRSLGVEGHGQPARAPVVGRASTRRVAVGRSEIATRPGRLAGWHRRPGRRKVEVKLTRTELAEERAANDEKLAQNAPVHRDPARMRGDPHRERTAVLARELVEDGPQPVDHLTGVDPGPLVLGREDRLLLVETAGLIRQRVAALLRGGGGRDRSRKAVGSRGPGIIGGDRLAEPELAEQRGQRVDRLPEGAPGLARADPELVSHVAQGERLDVAQEEVLVRPPGVGGAGVVGVRLEQIDRLEQATLQGAPPRPVGWGERQQGPEGMGL